MYLVRIPKVTAHIFPHFKWTVEHHQIALTFDDGPHSDSTPALLEMLGKYKIAATHFLTGKAAKAHPDMMAELVNSYQQIGHHSYSHFNGWKTNRQEYVDDCLLAADYIPSQLFRPPYGKITPGQWKAIKQQQADWQCIQYSLMPRDFDPKVDTDKLLKNLMQFRGGDIIVLHDKPECIAKLRPIWDEWVEAVRLSGLSWVSL